VNNICCGQQTFGLCTLPPCTHLCGVSPHSGHYQSCYPYITVQCPVGFTQTAASCAAGCPFNSFCQSNSVCCAQSVSREWAQSEMHPMCVQPYSHRHARMVCWQVDRALTACAALGSCVSLMCVVHRRLPHKRRLQVGAQCTRLRERM
jgi:hypothetical protein